MCPLVPFFVVWYCFLASYLVGFLLICAVVAGFFLAVVNGLLSLCTFTSCRGRKWKNPLWLIEGGEYWDEMKQISFRYNLFATLRLLRLAMWRQVFWFTSTGASEEPEASLLWENKPIGTTVSERKSGRRETTKAMLSKMAYCGSEQEVGGYMPETQQKKSSQSPSSRSQITLWVTSWTQPWFFTVLSEYLSPDTLWGGEIIIYVYVVIPSSIVVRWHKYLTA